MVADVLSGTSFIRDESNRATLSTRYTMHFHVDQETNEEVKINSIFKPFFYDSIRNTPIYSNPDFNTWEVRGLVVPDVAGAPHPGRVLDTVRFVALTPESLPLGVKNQVELTDKIFSGAQLVWGHMLASTEDPEARLAALCALTDKRTFAVFDPNLLSYAYRDSSHALLARESLRHTADIPLDALKLKQLIFTAGTCSASSTPPHNLGVTQPDQKKLLIRAFGLCLNGGGLDVNQALVDLLNSNDRLLEDLVNTLQITGAETRHLFGRVKATPGSDAAIKTIRVNQLTSPNSSLQDLRECVGWLRTEPQLAAKHVGELLQLSLCGRTISTLQMEAAELLQSIPGAIANGRHTIMAKLVTTNDHDILARAISLIGSDQEVATQEFDTLCGWIDEPYAPVREAALKALTIPDIVEQKEKDILRALDSEYPEVRTWAVLSLSSDPKAVSRNTEKLRTMIFDRNHLVGEALVGALASVPGTIALFESDLVEHLSSEDWLQLGRVAQVLAADPEVAKRHIGTFASLLEFDDAAVRNQARKSLMSTPGGVAAAEEHFVRDLENPCWKRRLHAVQAIGSDPTVAGRHLDSLRRLSEDEKPIVGSAALDAIESCEITAAERPQLVGPQLHRRESNGPFQHAHQTLHRIKAILLRAKSQLLRGRADERNS